MGEALVLPPLKSLCVTVFNKTIWGNNLKFKKILMCLLLSSETGFLYLSKLSILNYTLTTGMV